MPAETDVAVIGAGAAGLAAARHLADAGIAFELLEAAPRVGGRAFTDTTTFAAPVDLGCHWLHSAETNPFVPIADRLGWRYGHRAERTARRIHLGSRFADASERATAWSAVEEGFDAMRAAGAAGRDVSARDVLPGGPWDPLTAHWVALMTAAPPEQVSTRDFAFYHEGEENWPVLDGYGELVRAAAGDLQVRLNCPVRRIDRTGARLAVETPRGTLSARFAIVTASTTVLARETLAFFPALPADLMEVFAALPLGYAEKILIGFHDDVFGLGGARSSLDALSPDAGGDPITFLLTPGPVTVAHGYVGGTSAAELVAEGEAAMIDFTLAALTRVFGADIRRHAGRAVVTRWSEDPFIAGAYSCAVPGKAHLRAVLNGDLDGRIIFAGEAAAGPAFSTCHGAHLSGIAAAERVMVHMGARA